MDCKAAIFQCFIYVPSEARYKPSVIT